MKLSCYDLTTTDPAFNLAAEEHLFDTLPRDRMGFMLWQNDNAVIVGKYQNTFAEINGPYVREHGIRVVRRLSGGGAVYHDLGNLNFTFIAPEEGTAGLDFRLFCEPVIRTLARFGVAAELNGRNDMTIGGRKFSGNAQYVRRGRVMHHGTILFSSDLDAVSRALTPDADKYQTKAIRSVASRVTNVADHLPRSVSLADFRAALLSDIAGSADGEACAFSETDIAAIETLRRERYGTWEWNFGASPACTVHRHGRVEGCGTLDIFLTIENGSVSALTFTGDFFSLEGPEPLAARLIGCRPEAEAYRAALAGADVSRHIVGLTPDDLIGLLCD